jgi:hypothetical protein
MSCNHANPQPSSTFTVEVRTLAATAAISRAACSSNSSASSRRGVVAASWQRT